MACEAAGGSSNEAMPAACAIEMVHTYSLIHDDLPAMDDDDLRRGIPTSHKKFGEALAILAGDALLTLAFQVLADGMPASVAGQCCAELAWGAGAAGMVGGQVLDLEAEGRIETSSKSLATSQAPIERLRAIHRSKTGALFRSALRLGVYATRNGRPPEAGQVILSAMDRYAEAFGMVFQVTDDLLDVESSAEKTGKRVGKDAARGKLTYPGLLGIEVSRRQAQDFAREAEAAAESLGPRGQRLVQLVQYIVQRDR
jgi:geranylgeranyl diphosphate synthase type II